MLAIAREQQQLELQGLIARCGERRQCAQRAVVVFDLDGTLLDNRPRTVAILNDAAKNWAVQHPDAVRVIESLSPDQLGYLFHSALSDAGIKEELIREALELWKQRFFIDETLSHDVPLAGAVTFANACYSAGANLIYLTGRDLPNMALGSLASLRDHGFPVGVPGTELVLKPDFDTPDLTFKQAVMPELSRLGEVIATFDNEPGNCNGFQAQFPAATHYLLLTQFAPDPPALHSSVKVIRDFRAG